ncbi:hypothetical protein FAM8407_02832 [Lacticaseibacillus paracasei]|nr:hypothetical protein FAM8407_02832 [Lacticaseibacillus paracasei]
MVMYGHSFLVSNVVHVVHVVNPTHSNGLRVLYTWAKRGPCVVHRLQLRNWTGCGPGVDRVWTTCVAIQNAGISAFARVDHVDHVKDKQV